MKKELRLIKCRKNYTLQRKNIFGKWVYFKRYLRMTSYKTTRYFKSKDAAIDWYIEDYLKTNSKYVEILLIEIELIKDA